MSDVIEQGATRRLRPGDFSNPAPRNYGRREPGQSYRPGPVQGSRDDHREFQRPPPHKREKPNRDYFFERIRRQNEALPKADPNPNVTTRAQAARAFGRKFGRAVNPFGRVDTIATIMDGLLWQVPGDGLVKPKDGSGWELRTYCSAEWPRVDTSTGGALTLGSGPWPDEQCLGGQNINPQGGGGQGTTGILPPGVDYTSWSVWRLEGEVLGKYTHGASWKRDPSWKGTATELDFGIGSTVAVDPMPDANIMRMIPTLPPTSPLTAPPLPDPAGEGAAPPPRWKSFELRPKGRRPTGYFHKRRRPPRKTKERKWTGGRYIFDAADQLSELAEIIDAAFEALPDSVQDRYRGKPRWWQMPPEWYRDNQDLLDQAGQYGIDRADVKLVALWYNWHRLDGDKFARNLLGNLLVDKIMGEAHRRADLIGAHGL